MILKKIKFLANEKTLEDELKRGNLTALKPYLEEQIAYLEYQLRYVKGETYTEYQGALRALDDILELLP